MKVNLQRIHSQYSEENMKVVKIAIAALTAVTWIQIGLAAPAIQLPLGGGDATRQASSDSDTV